MERYEFYGYEDLSEPDSLEYQFRKNLELNKSVGP